MSTRFFRLVDPAIYSPIQTLNIDRFQVDSGAGTAMSSSRVDNEINRIVDNLNSLDDDISAIIAAGLPIQTTNADKMLTTDGTNASWLFVGQANMAGTASTLFGTDVSGNGDEVSIGTSLELVSGVLDIKDNGVTTAKIPNNTITTAKVADLAITPAKIANNTAFSMAGWDSLGAFRDIFLGDGLVRDSANLAVNFASEAEVRTGTNNTKVVAPLRIADVTPIIDRAFATTNASTAITATLPYDDTVPTSGEGTQVLSATLTPKTTTNKIAVRATVALANASASSHSVMAVFRGTTCIGYRATTQTSIWAARTLTIEAEDAPATTSPVTYTVRVGKGTGVSVRLNGDGAARKGGAKQTSTLEILELRA